MNDVGNTLQQTSDLLWKHWQEGSVLAVLPLALLPADRQKAYAVQALLEHRSHSPLYGWKIGATSTAGQKHIGADGPMCGRLLAEQVRHSSSAIDLTNNRMRVVECEFAFVMDHDLPPQNEPYTKQQVMAAVKSVHPAIEIPDSRYERFETVGAESLIADNACAHQFVLGPAATCNWKVIDLATQTVTAKLENNTAETVTHHGLGANVLGDPRIALTWLVNELSGLGVTLKAGAVATTGTCLVPIVVKPGDSVFASFGPIGEIDVSFIGSP